MSRLPIGRVLTALTLLSGQTAPSGQAAAADALELTMELHTRWNEVVVFRVPVAEGQPFHSEATSGITRHVVSGTVGPPTDGTYPVTLRLSHWTDARLTALQVLTLRVAPSQRWLGSTEPFSSGQLLAVTLAPIATDEQDTGGSHDFQTKTD